MSNPRLAATRLLTDLFNHKGSLAAMSHYSQSLAPEDKSLMQALVYGSCRWQPLLQAYLDTLMDKPLKARDRDIHALLLLGLYQLKFLSTPAHAVINETVNVTKQFKKPWASKLVNALLREYQRKSDALDQQFAKHHGHPYWLAKQLKLAWGDDAKAVMANNNLHPPMVLRVNCQKTTRDEYLALLSEAGIGGHAGSVCASSIYLESPEPVDRLPNFANGWVSVQDESPQLTPELMDLQPNLHLLDACSAPGGKTAHMLESEHSLTVVALDIKASRLERVADNMARLDLQAQLVVGDASAPESWWDGKLFDRILVDAPCSATGIIRRQPDIKILRQPDDIDKLSQQQLALLEGLWPLLAPGGLLVYATCSVLPAENTQVVEAFLKAQADAKARPIVADWGLVQAQGRQILPSAQGGDGFYYACIEKAPIIKA